MRELARRSGLSVAMVSEVLNDNTNPGLKFCTGIARAYDVPPETVLRMAGKIPQRTTRAELIQQILFYFDRMDETEQLRLITIAWSLSRESAEDAPNPKPNPC